MEDGERARMAFPEPDARRTDSPASNLEEASGPMPDVLVHDPRELEVPRDREGVLRGFGEELGGDDCISPKAEWGRV